MFRSVPIQVFFKVKVIIFGPKVSPEMADVMLIEELGSTVMLTEQF